MPAHDSRSARTIGIAPDAGLKVELAARVVEELVAAAREELLPGRDDGLVVPERAPQRVERGWMPPISSITMVDVGIDGDGEGSVVMMSRGSATGTTRVTGALSGRVRGLGCQAS